MADDEFHAVGGELVGDRHALLGVGTVVSDAQHDLLAEDAAGGIDVLDRLLDALLELGAEGGAAAGHRSAHRDLDVCACARRRESARPNTTPSTRPNAIFEVLKVIAVVSSNGRLAGCDQDKARNYAD